MLPEEITDFRSKREPEVACFPSLISGSTTGLGSHGLYNIVNKHFGKCSIYTSIQRLEGRTLIQPLGMSGSPSAVLWAGGITVFHQGSCNDGTLWYTYSADGTMGHRYAS